MTDKMNFIIVFSIKNNKPWESACWMTATEKATLDEARRVFDNFVAEIGRDNTDDSTIRGTITQVAVFRLRDKDTFTSKPNLYNDSRDKSDWLIGWQVAGFINAVNSDFSINK